ncbi:hypothetical protein [Acidiphilium sp.]|uniref:hypothetical protein n=1 Tax=Acidiphilium sp. TaxID=527 RepID=UPI002BF4028E|nr:hypothetical protein [Acidiphilium sp.]HQT62195.1 hypothetical protein [Acidiphilium sp.]
MTPFIFANNIKTTLASAVPSTATTITLASSTDLPSSIPTGYYLPITLNDAATGQIYEIVYATAVSGANLTVVRAQEGTSAGTWAIGDFVFSGPTAGQMTPTTAEIISVLTAAGIPPSASSTTQLLAALKTLKGALYQKTVAQSTTTANNTTYTLVTQSVTFPSYSLTGGFVVDGHGTLSGSSTAAMQQNFQLSLSDGTTTEDGVNWIIFTNANDACGVESSFVMPTVYAPGTTVTFTLAVAVAGGGAEPGQMAMNSAHLDLRVRNA